MINCYGIMVIKLIASIVTSDIKSFPWLLNSEIIILHYITIHSDLHNALIVKTT